MIAAGVFGILLSFLVAVALNLCFNGVGSADAAERDAMRASHAAEA